MRIVRAIGLVLVGAGIIILLFIAFQLWGTGLFQSQHQAELRHEFESLIHGNNKSSRATTSDTRRSTPTLAPHIAAPLPSRPVGTIEIPAIGLNQVIVEGVAENDLSLGPGHYPGTPLPGEAGNVGIAGHRTTWGHPFYNLNEVKPHDRIIITTVQGTFTYTPIAQHVVLPTDIAVLDPTHTPELTLTTCNPRYSAAQRLILVAKLTSSSIKQTVNSHPHAQKRETSTTPVFDNLASGKLNLFDTLIEGLSCVAIAVLIWLTRLRVSRKGVRRMTYVIGTLGFLVVLFFFFSSISLSLPASF